MVLLLLVPPGPALRIRRVMIAVVAVVVRWRRPLAVISTMLPLRSRKFGHFESINAVFGFLYNYHRKITATHVAPIRNCFFLFRLSYHWYHIFCRSPQNRWCGTSALTGLLSKFRGNDFPNISSVTRPRHATPPTDTTTKKNRREAKKKRPREKLPHFLVVEDSRISNLHLSLLLHKQRGKRRMHHTTIHTYSKISEQATMTHHHRPARILFGSCNSQHLKQPLWPAIMERNAQAFVWAGDAVYGDGHAGRNIVVATPTKLAADYEFLLTSDPYQKLMETNITILGTIDDHDYGVNNGDRTYIYKQESTTLFVDFLERSNHGKEWPLMRQRAETGEGVYGVAVFDFDRENELLSDKEAGIDPEVPARETPLSDKSVAIFMIDVRSNKDPWNSNGVKTDYQADFLGDKQWRWLEEGLRRSTAAVNILVSGLQVHTDRFIDGSIAEEWSRFPMAQHRLYQALLQPNVQAPFIISGDVHMGEFLRRDCQTPSSSSKQAKPSRRPLMEMTTSGMTHSWGTNFCSRPEPSNPVCRSTYLQSVLKSAMHWAHLNTVWKELVHDEVTHIPQYTLQANFGEFEFDWEDRSITMRIIGKDGVELVTRNWTMDALSGQESWGRSTLRDHHFDEAAQILTDHSAGSATMNDYYCLPYRGPQTTSHKYFGFITSFTMIAMGMFLPILLPLLVACRCLFSYRVKAKKD